MPSSIEDQFRAFIEALTGEPLTDSATIVLSVGDSSASATVDPVGRM